MSLYRKYRPQTFEDVVGQEHIAQTLRNALSARPLRVAHAYLFCGPRGTGKTTSARLLAKCLNCEQGPTPTPCNQCDFCTRVRDNQAVMDLVEIDAASHTGVDNVREVIIEKVNIAPAQGRYRVYIIDEVHMLSTSSFNALLKTLEEPPPHAIFILATTDSHRVPTTISSRCQRFDFRRVGPQDIVQRLQYVAEQENIKLDEQAARLIAYTADGALRDALTLLEQVTAFSAETITEADVRLVLGTVSQELLLQIVDAVAQSDAVAALQCIERATEEGVSFSQLTRDLTGYGRDLLLLTVGFQSEGILSEDEKHRRQQHARQIGRPRLLQFVEAMRTAEKEMRQSTDHRLLLELTLVRAASPAESLAPAPVAQPVRQAIPARNAAEAPVATGPRGRIEESAATPAWRQPAAEATAPAAVDENAGMPGGVETTSTVQPPVTSDEPPAVAAGEAGSDAVAVEAVAVEPVGVENENGSSETEVPVSPPPAPVRKGRRIHNFEEFVELWPKVLVRVKKKIGVTAVAYLHDAIPVGFTDKEAILEFQKEFHYEKACEAAKRLPFEQVVNETLATPHVLQFRLRPPRKKAVVVVEENLAPDDDHDDDDDDVLKLAQDMFAGQVVGRSGQG